MAPPTYQTLTPAERSAVDLAANILALVRLLYLKAQGSVPRPHPTTQVLNYALRDSLQRVRQDPQYDSLGDGEFKTTYEGLTDLVYRWGDDGGCEVENLNRVGEVLGEFEQTKRFWEIYVATEIIVRDFGENVMLEGILGMLCSAQDLMRILPRTSEKPIDMQVE